MITSFGRNLPVTDSDFMIAKIEVFGAADVVTSIQVSSQRAYSVKQSGPFLIDRYSVALGVAGPNAKIRSNHALVRHKRLYPPLLD